MQGMIALSLKCSFCYLFNTGTMKRIGRFIALNIRVSGCSNP
jgi:hypothetical protein